MHIQHHCSSSKTPITAASSNSSSRWPRGMGDAMQVAPEARVAVGAKGHAIAQNHTDSLESLWCHEPIRPTETSHLIVLLTCTCTEPAKDGN